MPRLRAGDASWPSRLTSRLVLRAPRRPTDSAGERHATWLELFFDVIFVLALGAVIGRLGDDPVPRPSLLLAVCGLFVVVQWAWVGQVFYDTRYDPDDAPHRMSVLVALLGAGAITLGVDEVPESVLLPVGYLLVRGILLLLYLRARPADTTAREVTGVYLAGFGAGWLIWLGSLAAPASARPPFWVVAMCVELATPWLGLRRLSRSPVDARHLPERIGQFAMIVLGSTLANLLDAVPDHPRPRMIAAAAVAFSIPASVWWVYTTFVTSGFARVRLGGGQGYTYLNIPLNGALLLLGWALGQVVRHVTVDPAQVPAGLRALLGASVVTWMLCGLGIYWLAVGRPDGRRLAISGFGVGSAVAVTATAASPLPLLLLLAVTMVGYAVLVSQRLTAVAAR